MTTTLTSPVSLPIDGPLVNLTRPKPWLWIIELHNGQDSRLTEKLVDDGLKPALDVVEREWRDGWRKAEVAQAKAGGEGAVIIVGRRDQDKFFSNGLDYASAIKNDNFHPVTFSPLLTRLLSFPIPTIAAINGHCFAGGFMLALACDYRVAIDGSKRYMWLCMNEVEFGAAWPQSFAAILRAKVGDPRLRRRIALEGHRFTPTEALAAGFVDELVNGKTADVLASAEALASKVSKNAHRGVWGLIKSDVYRDTLEHIRVDYRRVDALTEDHAARSRL